MCKWILYETTKCNVLSLNWVDSWVFRNTRKLCVMRKIIYTNVVHLKHQQSNKKRNTCCMFYFRYEQLFYWLNKQQASKRMKSCFIKYYQWMKSMEEFFKGHNVVAQHQLLTLWQLFGETMKCITKNNQQMKHYATLNIKSSLNLNVTVVIIRTFIN